VRGLPGISSLWQASWRQNEPGLGARTAATPCIGRSRRIDTSRTQVETKRDGVACVLRGDQTAPSTECGLMPMCGCRSAGSARRRQSVPGASEDRLCRTLAAPSSRSHARSVVRGRALAASPGAPLTWVACRQDCGHQMLQRADEVLFAHQDGAVAGMDDVDRASWGCPVRRGDGQDLLDEVFPAAASVRLEVSSARRRMLPSQAISVITTLTQTSLPASARETASHLWQRQECRKVQRDPCYALGSPAVVAEHPRMRVTPNIRGARRSGVWARSGTDQPVRGIPFGMDCSAAAHGSSLGRMPADRRH
jgi:hypothetical protein